MYTILWKEHGSLKLSSPYEPETQEIMKQPNSEKACEKRAMRLVQFVSVYGSSGMV